MKVFFWQNMPSHIQTGALDHFASLWPDEVTGVWCEDISPARKALGWGQDSRAHLKDIFLPAQNWEGKVSEIVAANPQAIHILSAIGAYPPVTLAAKLLSRQAKPRLGLIVEPAILMGWKGPLRQIKARWNYRTFLDKITAVLAMGTQGRDFYLTAGFKPAQIFPFLYQCPFGRVTTVAPHSGKVKFVYVGQFHTRKGVDQLVEAFAGLKGKVCSLTLYGRGPLESLLKERVEKLGLQGQVDFPGVVSAPDVVKTLALYDVCCIPSRFDGWGVVTNEAIQAGIPPIVSSTASSCDLVRYSGAGRIYPAGQVVALTNCLAEYVSSPDLIQKEKLRAVNYSIHIMPETVGKHLNELFSHLFLNVGPRPSSPWVINL